MTKLCILKIWIYFKQTLELGYTTFQDDLFWFSTAWFTFFQRGLGQTKAIYIECHTLSHCPSTRSCPDCPGTAGGTKEKAAAAWDWLPARSAVGFGTRWGCLKNNWFQFYFVCTAQVSVLWQGREGMQPSSLLRDIQDTGKGTHICKNFISKSFYSTVIQQYTIQFINKCLTLFPIFI